jgi:hypothetical protein
MDDLAQAQDLGDIRKVCWVLAQHCAPALGHQLLYDRKSYKRDTMRLGVAPENSIGTSVAAITFALLYYGLSF